MNDLKARRNRGLLWQVPLFIVILWAIWTKTPPDAVFPLLIVCLVACGLASQGMATMFDYNAADDQKSATLRFYHEWSFRSFFAIPLSAFAKAKDGFDGLLIAILAFFTLPIWWGFLSFFQSHQFFNKLWWLKDYSDWRQRLLSNAKSNNNRDHVRGTNILPSVELSGDAPTKAEEDPGTPPQPLEAIDGLLTLNPDGGIILGGGVAFDRNSTFSGFSMNGLTMTRESPELLKVSYEGSDKQFRFDGSRWYPV